MRRVAVATVLIVAAATAATFLVHSAQERDAAREQARTEHDEFMRHMERVERMLSLALAGKTEVARLPLPGATSAGSAAREQKDAGVAREAANRHEERIQAGNVFVDQTIANGVWNPADLTTLLAATQGLTGEERAQIMARIAVAINSDRVRLAPPRRSQ